MAKNRKSNISIKDIFKGKFLVEEGSARNWGFGLYLIFLAFVAISSSHWLEKKVVEINRLNEEVANLKSQYTDAHRELMKMQLEPEIRKQSEKMGITITEVQPYVLIKEIYDQEP
ncbi:MAG: FtsL-like putative cell division protein [Moheibacter sp.]